MGSKEKHVAYCEQNVELSSVKRENVFKIVEAFKTNDLCRDKTM